MPCRDFAIAAIAVSLLATTPASAPAEGFGCDASVIDVVIGEDAKVGDRLGDDVYVVPSSEIEVTTESVFDVFRPDEVNEEPIRHYPLMLYVGRMRVIDVQDEVVIGRMVELTSGAEHPRLRHGTVMIGDCLRLQDGAGDFLTVGREELPAETLDVSGLKFAGTETPKPSRVIPSKVLFKFDSSVVEEKWSEDLAQIADYILREKPARVIVEGHADWIGADEYNMKLSERRARAMIDYLVGRHGLDRGIFETEPHGESRPEASNESAAGRRKNRRAATILLFQAVPAAQASAAAPDWPLAVASEELVPEDAAIPIIESELPDEDSLIEEF